MEFPEVIPPRLVTLEPRSRRATLRRPARSGMQFRIGYYGRTDGLDCIWLVNEAGEYEQTTDHDDLRRHYVVDEVSDETDLYGDDRPVLGPLQESTGARPKSRVPAGV